MTSANADSERARQLRKATAQGKHAGFGWRPL
jgi:hypothetical protein